MSDHLEVVLDRILDDLTSLVKAESEAAVLKLEASIEDAIECAAKELQLAAPLRGASVEEFDGKR